jgi:putative membrane protein
VRVYRFSLGLGVVAILSGLWLFWWWSFPALGLDEAGRRDASGGPLRLDRAADPARRKRGIFDESDLWLRVFNEISVLGAIGVLILVVFKPF